MIGEDKRFDETRDDFCRFLAFWVYQMLWVWIVSLPVTFVNGSSQNPAMQASDVAGILMFCVGLLVEAISDQQKFNFKQYSPNKAKWCSTGLWAWSRHPNYFGMLAVIAVRLQ
jgi:steroid 5-alpha reductase family enzyme